MAAAPKIPIGTVIENGDKTNSIWDGKNWLPATQGPRGWMADRGRMAAMGLGTTPGGQIDPNDSKVVNGYHNDFTDADSLAQMATRFMDLNRQTSTGPVYAVPGAQMVGGALDGNVKAMSNLSSQMATRMRAPGMRLTQMEFSKFLGDVPSPSNTGDANQKIVANIYLARTLAAAKASYYASYLGQHRSLAGADAGWLSWRNQHFGPLLDHYTSDAQMAQGQGQPQPQPQAQPAQPAAPQPMAAPQPKAPHAMSDDELRAALGQ